MKVLTSVDATFDTAGLEGKAFIVTKSGACFRTMKKRYEQDLGIIQFKKTAMISCGGLIREEEDQPASFPLMCCAIVQGWQMMQAIK